ncbi:DUF2854 domain-containing protein [Calothrix sp. 336/3]|uniref:DUF2854 domain-containing protein n=1 Tax=Calothrix sp. 336/3 TaxID=1337936 RepID=UPI0004E2E98B|nr:DUF2854 domain-containing protein [Calothrix sp. 336/3]AKG24074.1 membrane protein [Calothrix sp. 336/3]
MLRKFSLGTLGLVVGGILTIMGFVAYAQANSTLNLIGFFYGLPLLLGGLALKTNELKPLAFTQPTTPEVLALRETQATTTQNLIRTDITRYSYGMDTHFDRALEYLKLTASDDDRPVITGLRETEINGAYSLILEFDSPDLPLATWQQFQEKMVKYFGPGVDVQITQPETDKIELALITVAENSQAVVS